MNLCSAERPASWTILMCSFPCRALILGLDFIAYLLLSVLKADDNFCSETGIIEIDGVFVFVVCQRYSLLIYRTGNTVHMFVSSGSQRAVKCVQSNHIAIIPISSVTNAALYCFPC